MVREKDGPQELPAIRIIGPAALLRAAAGWLLPATTAPATFGKSAHRMPMPRFGSERIREAPKSWVAKAYPADAGDSRREKESPDRDPENRVTEDAAQSRKKRNYRKIDGVFSRPRVRDAQLPAWQSWVALDRSDFRRLARLPFGRLSGPEIRSRPRGSEPRHSRRWRRDL
jgi:hypothetical protein